MHTKRRGDFKAKAVILDVGTKPRALNIPGEKEFIGKGVAYCATCDGEFFKGKHIYVLGAGDQAIGRIRVPYEICLPGDDHCPA